MDLHRSSLMDSPHPHFPRPHHASTCWSAPSSLPCHHLRQPPLSLDLLPHPWRPPPPTAQQACHKRTRKVPNIFKDQHTKDQFQINMQEWFDTHPCPLGADLTPETASTYLQNVSQDSTAVGLGGIQWKYKRWKSYRDGWSPHMLANQAQYMELITRTQQYLVTYIPLGRGHPPNLQQL